jgi:hypothetical protein
MSTNAAGVTGKVQFPIAIGNNLNPVGSSASRALAVIRSDAERPLTIPDPCMSAAPQTAAPAAFAGAFFGCLVTLHFSAFGVMPEIASALVTTLLGGQLLITRSTILSAREFVPAVYGGAFGGMTSVLWLSGMGSEHPDLSVVGLFISLSVFCGLAFSAVAIFDAYAGRRWTHGYGGRSGAIATVACVLFVQLAALAGADDGLFHIAREELADFNVGSLAPVIAACLSGTVVTLLVLRRARVAAADLADRTFVASAVALIGLLVVHRMSPTDARLLEAYYAGCFLGMSSRERLNGWIETVLGAIVLAGLIIQVRIFLPGIGGGLGLAAFVTVAILVILKQFTRFVLPINRSENMATQLPIVRNRFEHRVPSPPSERRRNARGGISWRPVAVIASLAVVAALIGGLIWPAQLASKKAIAVATTSVSAGEVATPDPAAPQAELRSSAIDAVPAPAADPGSGSMPGENTPRENKSSEIATDISAASTVGLRLSSAVVDEPAAAPEESKTAELVTSQPNTSEPKTSEPKIAESKVAEPMTADANTVPPVTSDVIAARGPALGEPQKDDDSFARDALFREYLRWRAARVSAVTSSTRQTAAKNHHHVRPLAGIATPPANPPPRSEHPLSSAQTPSVTSPMPRPRRPHPGNPQTHAAIEPATPAPAASSPSF